MFQPLEVKWSADGLVFADKGYKTCPTFSVNASSNDRCVTSRRAKFVSLKKTDVTKWGVE